MQLQVQLFPNHTLTPPIFSPPSHFLTHTKPVPNSSRFKSGYCNSLKRVSESQIGLRNHGGFGFIANSKLNSGFCNSLKKMSELHGDDDNDDGYYMRRAVELARKAIGFTSPNPMVGCVIVKDGKIVGEGFHPKAGQPHAEVFALRDAGDLAENATAYVSLEPCNHYGRTPPCTEALIKAKVKKVVVGMVDPNPIVASKGVDRLRDAGIEVTVGVEEELCKKLNEAYIHQMLTGKPFLTLRYSISANGCFLNQLGEEVMESGGYYSKLLQEYDAIILSPTLITEKCSFPSSQEPGANQPLQIIIAKTPSSPIQVSDITTEASSKVIIFTDKETTVGLETAQKGIETVVLDQLNVDTILEYCKRRGMCSVLLDLRGNCSDVEDLLTECLGHNLLQKVVIEVLPLWKGSIEEERDLMALNNLGRTVRLKTLISKFSDKSVVLEGYF